MRYVIDTSALIDAWTTWYAPDILPAFWDRLRDLASSSQASIPDAVLFELSAQDDDLLKWCRQHESVLVLPMTDEIQGIVRRLSNAYPSFRTSGVASKNFADPIVIATAAHYGCSVVTHEQPTNNPNGPKMPDICRQEGLRHLDIPRMVRDLGWTF